MIIPLVIIAIAVAIEATIIYLRRGKESEVGKERKVEVKPVKVWGSVLIAIGLYMFLVSFNEARNLTRASPVSENVAWLLIMLVIAGFLLTKGMGAVRSSD